jgi:hypothetical protein
VLPGKRYSVDDVLYLAWRWWWLLVVPWVVVAVVSFVVVRRLPDSDRKA